MAFGGVVNIALRVFQLFFAILVTALTGNMIAESFAGNPSIVNFSIFCGIFAMLCLLYLIPAAIKDSLMIHGAIPLALDALNTIFWFCAAVALAAKLGVHSCSDTSYIRHNSITNGTRPGNQSGRCREAQATDAFLWFGFAAFAASTVLSGIGMGRTGGKK